MKVEEQIAQLLPHCASIPKKSYKHKNILCRCIYGMSYEAALSAESEGRQLIPEMNAARTKELAAIHGKWIHELVETTTQFLTHNVVEPGACIKLGDYLLVANEKVFLAHVLRTYRAQNSLASPNAVAHFLLQKKMVTSVTEHPDVSYAYTW